MIGFGDQDKILFIPGPTPVHRRILKALATPTISHTSAEFAGIFRSVVERLSQIMDNEDGRTFVFSGSGTLAQEAAITNFVQPGQRLLLASNGFFGDRFAQIAEAFDVEVIHLRAPWGRFITPDQLEEAARSSVPDVVVLTHVETSTGAQAPLEELLGRLTDTRPLVIVDGVCALGGIPEPMSKLGIDVLISGSQKALGVPPGLSIIGVSRRGWEVCEAGQSLPRYYADLRRWAPVMERPETYFSTHPINLIYGLQAALDIILEEGLEQRFERHTRLAQRIREGLLELGFSLFTDAAVLAPTLTVVTTPDGVTASGFRRRLSEEGIVAAAGIQDAPDRVLRFGHMGNIGELEIAAALDACCRALRGARE
ncbi:MAG TPA: alanine--glyoxylate aminotransferase family protein [Chloroflexota bacterium]|nr:alanine--glyoxylate aminotransferase family protein [Chloroflexota bacterium]